MENPKTNTSPDFHLIGIGASAGGLKAIQDFFTHISEKIPASFVLMLHRSADSKDLLNELLADKTNFKIKNIKSGETINPQTIYIAPAQKFVKVKDQRLYLLSQKNEAKSIFTIDLFFHSLGEDFKEKSIGIVLSGTGTDASRGIKNIHQNSGKIYVQSPESAKHPDMPKASLETNLVDYFGKTQEIAKEINEKLIPEKSFEFLLEKNISTPENQIIQTLSKEKKINLEYYKTSHLSKQINQRAKILGISDLETYYKFITNDKKEQKQLLENILVNVSQFFRNVSAFVEFGNLVIPQLFKTEKKEIKIAVLACSTGEEAYTIAMMMADYKAKSKSNKTFKIYASDINKSALEIAEKGIYAFNLVEQVPEKYLKKYFHDEIVDYEIVSELKENIVFESKNILEDELENDFDLISCRHFLTELKAEFQKQIIEKISNRVSKGGFLFFDKNFSVNSEQISVSSYQLSVISLASGIFQVIENEILLEEKQNPIDKKEEITENETIKPEKQKENPKNQKPIPQSPNLPEISENKSETIKPEKSEVEEENQENPKPPKLITQPPKNKKQKLITDTSTSLGNRNCSIISDNIERFFNFPTRPEDFSLEYLLDGKTLQLFKEKIDWVLKEQKTLKLEGFPFQKGDNYFEIAVNFELENEKDLVIEILESKEINVEKAEELFKKFLAQEEKPEENKPKTKEALENENLALKAEIDDLRTLNQNITKLLVSNDIGTIFLDNELKIRRFTQTIKEQFHFSNEDLGKSIIEFKIYFGIENLDKTLTELLENQTAKQIQIFTPESHPYLLKISPFETLEKKNRGLSLSFVDVLELHQTRMQLQEKVVELEQANEYMDNFVYTVAHDLRSPVNNLIALVSLIEDKTDPLLDKIDLSAKRLKNTIQGLEQIIDINKVNEESIREINLKTMYEAIRADLQNEIADSNAEIKIDFQVEEMVYVEPYLHSILLNMTTNALKYQSEKRDLILEVKSQEEEDFILLSFRDNGIGIDMEKQGHKLFKPFTRLTTQATGKGIGLLLIKNMVEKNGGKIEVESQEDVGTIFKIYLKAY